MFKAILCRLIILWSAFVGCDARAQEVFQRLYINSGEYTAVDSAQFPFSAFNATPQFFPENVRISINAGETLKVRVVNNDSVNHAFQIKDKTTQVGIAPGDSILVTAVFDTGDEVFIYHDPMDYPRLTALGLAGLIHVKSNSNSTFYWNVKEFQKEWATQHALGNPVNWSDYYPDYFTINGRSNPNINNDAVARIVGGVGETLRVVIANTGQSIHSLHFHGYHAEIIYSSENSQHEGRSKDTFPIKPMESLILEIVPDKPGEYPVHDHNLVAVSAGGIYPNGMFLTMLIQ